MIDLPDLSHLNPDEQEKIRGVIQRQHDEEQKEKNMLKVIQSEFEDYKKQIKNVNKEANRNIPNGHINNNNNNKDSKPTSPSTPDAPSCMICNKTKFAEGCGHECMYCEKKFCSRCGARIRIITKDLKANITMWVCTICRKQQDILIKSGKSTMVPNFNMLINNQSEHERNFVLQQIKHPPAATSKVNGSKNNDNSNQNGENYSLDSALRSSSDMTVDCPPHGKTSHDDVDDVVLTQPCSTNLCENKEFNDFVCTQRLSNMSSDRSVGSNNVVVPKKEHQNAFRKSQSNFSHLNTTAAFTQNSPTPRVRAQSTTGLNKYGDNITNSTFCKHRQSYSSHKVLHKSRSSQIQVSSPNKINSQHKTHAAAGTGKKHIEKMRSNKGYNNVPAQLIAEVCSENVIACRSEPNIIAISNNSNQSNISPSENQKRVLKYFDKNYSISSSEEEVRSTPDYSSFDDAEKETSISDDDYLSKRSSYNKRKTSSIMQNYKQKNRPSHSMSTFHISAEQPCTCSPDTSSNNRNLYSNSFSTTSNIDRRSHGHMPVSWQPSGDGKFLIGHLLLSKTAGTNVSTTDVQQNGVMLGLKVVGGKMTKVGRKGAFITKVKKGGLADIVGHLKPGDEVISWNEKCLQDASFDEVYDIILASKYDDVVELIVSRPIKDVPRIPETRLHHAAESSSCSLDSERKEMEVFDAAPLKGLIQIKMCYDDMTQQLDVTAIRAVELPLREGGLPRNPYLKMYLLPDRSNVFKRRTKTAKKTLCPEWNQTFFYSDVRKEDLGAMALELSLWDYDRSLEANSKFMGEVMVDLGLVSLNDDPRWFRLMPLGYGMNQDYTMAKSFPKESMSMSVIQSSRYDDSSPQLERNAFSVSIPHQRKSNMASRRRIASQSTNTMGRRQLPNLPSESKQVVESPVVEKKSMNLMQQRKMTTPTTTNDSNSITNSATESFSNKKTSEHSSVDKTLQSFVGGLGPGQVVGRQVLAVKSVGELECGLYERSGQLEVQVIRARHLLRKPTAKVQPATYVKVYLMFGLQCVAKKKTKLSRRTLNPNFHQTVAFDPSQYGKSLQLIVWGDYGRMDNKVFMGVAQISLEGLDLASNVIGWYKLYPASSVIDTAVLSLRKGSSSSFGSSSHISSRDYSD